MRLKFLFFPIMLVISVSLFVGFIWPEIQKVQQLSEDKSMALSSLSNIQEEKDSITLIKNKITSDETTENLVKNYLPENKSEEVIIGGLNYLATASGVSLVSVEIKEPSSDSDQAISKPVATVATTVSDSAAASKKEPLLNETAVIVNGDYEKIKLFLDQIDRMSIYNKVKSVTITKQTQQESENSSPASFLSANIVVDFGYMNPQAGQKMAITQPKLDDETIKTLKDYVTTSSTSINTEKTAGRSNPFMAN